MKFTFKKRTRIYSSLFASLAFIALAVWGWDLPVSTVFVFLVLCLGFLIAIVACAALLAWVLHTIRSKRAEPHELDDSTYKDSQTRGHEDA